MDFFIRGAFHVISTQKSPQKHKIRRKTCNGLRKLPIFAAAQANTHLGLTGFDSGMSLCVSMQ
jgi:hypothetical protein